MAVTFRLKTSVKSRSFCKITLYRGRIRDDHSSLAREIAVTKLIFSGKCLAVSFFRRRFALLNSLSDVITSDGQRLLPDIAGLFLCPDAEDNSAVVSANFFAHWVTLGEFRDGILQPFFCI